MMGSFLAPTWTRIAPLVVRDRSVYNQNGRLVESVDNPQNKA